MSTAPLPFDQSAKHQTPAEPAEASTLPKPVAPSHTALTAEVQSQVATIQSIAGECAAALAGTADEFAKGLALARGMRQLREAFTPAIMADVGDLAGNPLGFNVDRPNNKSGPYSREELRDGVIHAMIKGARLVGNEFTLISGRAYLNKEHYERRLRELEGFADLDIQAGVPSMAGGGGALVPITATWTFRGQPFSLERTLRKSADGTADDRRIPVRINNGQGADAAVGKATRKLLAQIHRRLTGSNMSEDDQEDLETVDGEVIDNVMAQESAGEEPAPADVDAVDQGDGGGFDYGDFLTEYSEKLQAAVEAGSIVECGKALAWATTQAELPDDVRRQVEQMRLDAVIEIKSKRGENSNRSQ